MLEVARRTLPDVPLHHTDMREFELGRTFDVAELAHYVRELIKLIPSVASSPAR
jgi:hypothetical protein